jgi:cell division inhibitor SepF
MGAMRKAGVWLGLVEDEGDADYDDPRADRRYDDRGGRFTARRYEDARERRYADDDLDGYEDEFEEPPARTSRVEPVAARSVGRVPAVSAPLTHDNLALAPQVALRERAVVAEPSEMEDTSYRITTLHPTTYNEARTIGEHYRNAIPVILNLTDLDESDAKRLVDFAAGLTFGLRGSMERVTNRVFLLSPANVTVTAEDKARIAEGGFFNQS